MTDGTALLCATLQYMLALFLPLHLFVRDCAESEGIMVARRSLFVVCSGEVASSDTPLLF